MGRSIWCLCLYMVFRAADENGVGENRTVDESDVEGNPTVDESSAVSEQLMTVHVTGTCSVMYRGCWQLLNKTSLVTQLCYLVVDVAI